MIKKQLAFSVPQVHLRNLRCTNFFDRVLSCTVDVPPTCEELRYQLDLIWTIEPIFPCDYTGDSQETILSTVLDRYGEVHQTFFDLISYAKYEVSVHLNNSVSFGRVVKNYTTKPADGERTKFVLNRFTCAYERFHSMNILYIYIYIYICTYMYIRVSVFKLYLYPQY